MNEHSRPTKTVQVFSNGRSRAIRIPKEFEFEGDRVEISRDAAGDLIVHPVKRKSLLEILNSLQPLPEDEQLPDIDDPPPEPVDLDWPDEK